MIIWYFDTRQSEEQRGDRSSREHLLTNNSFCNKAAKQGAAVKLESTRAFDRMSQSLMRKRRSKYVKIFFNHLAAGTVRLEVKQQDFGREERAKQAKNLFQGSRRLKANR